MDSIRRADKRTGNNVISIRENLPDLMDIIAVDINKRGKTKWDWGVTNKNNTNNNNNNMDL